MKAKIFKYWWNKTVYYAEGFDEPTVRLCLENYLQIPQGSLKTGEKPDLEKELKLIWNKSNKTHKLTLTKEHTTSKEELQLQGKKMHCLYELKLLLKEDERFLSGVRGDIAADEENEVKFWGTKYIHPDGSECGIEMCWSFQGSRSPEMTDRIYRFRNIGVAYRHIRYELIKYGLADDLCSFNKNFTNLEMCDSFITGFGNADMFREGENIHTRTPHKVNEKALKELYYK